MASSSSASRSPRRHDFDIYPVEYYAPHQTESFRLATIQEETISAHVVQTPVPIEGIRRKIFPKNKRSPSWIAMKVWIRIISISIAITLLVLDQLAGLYLPRGSDWDLLWDVLFVPVALYNGTCFCLFVHRHKHSKRLPPQGVLSHVALSITDILIFIALGVFSLVDIFKIIQTSWHYDTLAIAYNDGLIPPSPIIGNDSPSVVKKDVDLPSKMSFASVESLLPDLIVDGNSLRPLTPQELAGLYQPWNNVAIAACIFAGVLAVMHFVGAFVELLEWHFVSKAIRAEKSPNLEENVNVAALTKQKGKLTTKSVQMNDETRIVEEVEVDSIRPVS